MGHMVNGIIGERNDIIKLIIDFKIANKPYLFDTHFSLLPMSDNDIKGIDANVQSTIVKGFSSLSEIVFRKILENSKNCKFVYFETEYFGGEGLQSAVLISNGEVSFGPQTGQIGPINFALSKLGVTVGEKYEDEFMSIGLDRYRSTEGWINAANKQIQN